MKIHQLIEELHALAVENPTATVINGAEVDEEVENQILRHPKPVDQVVYNAEDNTIVIDP